MLGIRIVDRQAHDLVQAVRRDLGMLIAAEQVRDLSHRRHHPAGEHRGGDQRPVVMSPAITIGAPTKMTVA